MFKRLVIILFVILVLSSVVMASPVINVNVNNEVIAFDVPPQIVEGRTLVPLKGAKEGNEVFYDTYRFI